MFKRAPRLQALTPDTNTAKATPSLGAEPARRLCDRRIRRRSHPKLEKGRAIPSGHKHRCRLMGVLSRFLPTDAHLCIGNLTGRGLRIAPGLFLLFRRGRLHEGVDNAST